MALSLLAFLHDSVLRITTKIESLMKMILFDTILIKSL